MLSSCQCKGQQRPTHVKPAGPCSRHVHTQPAAGWGLSLLPTPMCCAKLLEKEGCSSCPRVLPFPSHLQAQACAYKRSGNLAGWKEERSQGSGAEPKCSRSALWELHQKGNRSRERAAFSTEPPSAIPSSWTGTNWSCTRTDT